MNLKYLNTAEWFSLVRIILFPLVLVLAILDLKIAFKWSFLIVFSTDFIDGFFAKFHSMESDRRARLDTAGDALLLMAGILGIYIFETQFILGHLSWILVVTSIYLVEVVISLVKFRQMVNLHTFMAKINAFLLVLFIIISLFFQPYEALLYLSLGFTCLTLAEEIFIIVSIKKVRSNVNGFWEV